MTITELEAKIVELNEDAYHQIWMLEESNIVGNALMKTLKREMDEVSCLEESACGNNLEISICKKLLAWLQERIPLLEETPQAFENLALAELELACEEELEEFHPGRNGC